MSEYKPKAGDFVQVVNRGDGWVGLRGIVTGATDKPGGIAFYEIGFPEFVTPEGDRAEKARFMVSELRPLVVLDLTEHEALELAGHLDGTGKPMGYHDRVQVARAVRRQTSPPRIPEPGAWGVVNAAYRRDELLVRKWVRYGTGWRDAFGKSATWDDLIHPVLVREGA